MLCTRFRVNISHHASHFQVYPMELFEEGAEFVDILSRYFAGAHGQRLKSAYADALIHLLLPVAKSASAEMNHPTWVKALDAITPRAFVMASKPRYWPVAYPLYVACLCASPEDKFLQNAAGWNWFACVEAGVAKFKVSSARTCAYRAPSADALKCRTALHESSFSTLL